MLLDLGFATQEPYSSYVCGTTNYYAPEVVSIDLKLESDLKYTNAVDIWGLGAFLYEVFSGRAAFTDNDKWLSRRDRRTNIKNKIRLFSNHATQLHWPWHVETPLQKAVGQMMTKNAEDRVTIEQVVAMDVFQQWDDYCHHALNDIAIKQPVLPTTAPRTEIGPSFGLETRFDAADAFDSIEQATDLFQVLPTPPGKHCTEYTLMRNVDGRARTRMKFSEWFFVASTIKEATRQPWYCYFLLSPAEKALHSAYGNLQINLAVWRRFGGDPDPQARRELLTIWFKAFDEMAKIKPDLWHTYKGAVDVALQHDQRASTVVDIVRTQLRGSTVRSNHGA